MPSAYARYRRLDYRLPETYLSWDLFGAGPDHLGRDGRPVELPLVEPRDDELLLRVDAIGLCFSDTKLIWAGDKHPRIPGRDLAADPTVPGHEAALTVARVGRDWANKFSVGQRFIIQADIFVNGQQRAFGYVQRGALAQFTYVGPEVLDGDDGCYLLPMGERSGYAEAALVEPWACVEDAYHIPARRAPKPGGRLLLVVLDGLRNPREALADCYRDGAGPAVATMLYPGGAADRPVLPTDLLYAGKVFARDRSATVDGVREARRAHADDAGFDDVFVFGVPSPELMTALDAALARHGHLVLVGADGAEPAAFDIGRVHYDYTRHLAAPGARVADAYTANVREELKAGGATWMVGAAGPMGQMHMQRALELDHPPAVLRGTDVNPERLAYLVDRLAPLAEKRGVRLDAVNTADLDPAALAARLADGAASGYDDVYVHAPVAPLVSQGAGRVADGGVLNIFAGVPLGTMATLDPELFTRRHARMIGSSGSSMASFKSVFERMESGKLATRMSLAALGGVNAGHEGILGVKSNRFPGKTVLFPAIRDFPLVELDGLAAVAPAVAEKLERGSIWTNEAEETLLDACLALD